MAFGTTNAQGGLAGELDAHIGSKTNPHDVTVEQVKALPLSGGRMTGPVAMDESIINFAINEDSTEYVGMANATLPSLNALTQSISGAVIAGNIEAVILGHFDALTLGLILFSN